MKNKTCGECKCYDMHGGCNKVKNTLWIHSTNIACIKFEAKNPTIGDKIRQMSNEGLAKLIVPKVIFCDGCPVKCEEKDIPQSKINPFGADVIEDVCTKRVEAWLNAPADACVKQNGNHDTQLGLCVADNTESEGKDE